MSNICIIYNPHNLLTCLVALIKRNQILSQSEDEDNTVRLIPYERSSNFDTITACDHFAVIGVELHKKHLKRLVGSSKGLGAVYALINTYQYDTEDLTGLIVHRVVDDFEWLTMTIKYDEITSDMRRLLTTIRKYQDFELLSIDELLSVFINQETIQQSLDTGSEYDPIYINPINRPAILASFQKQLSTVRTIISNNFEARYYGTATVGNNIPTASVPGHFASMAMRQISYPFDSFIVYEDLKSCRLWRIVTRYPTEGDTIANTMAPFDIWHDGMITYAVTALPQIHITK